jgi:predicted CoA-binding protein
MLGKESRIWWDKKLRGNDDFDDTLVTRLQRVALLVSVVSPRYVRSEWGRKEILAFCQAAAEQGGIEIQDKCRLFKVLKTQVPLEQHPPELQSVLGYEFFKIDPETGKARELNEIFGPEAERDFWIKLDDLAHDMCNLLQLLERRARGLDAGPAALPRLDSVYLAVTTSDAKDERAAIKRELEQHGYRVLPDRPLPLTEEEVEAAVRADLAECRLSIHIVGKTYGVIPEGGTLSLCEIQNELAIARGEAGGFSRLVWIQPGLEIDDERQRQAIERVRNDPRILRGADVLETPFEDLRTIALARLRADEPSMADPEEAPAGPPHLYLIHDQRDTQAISAWADFLFTDFEVIRPVFDGDEADTRAYHEENLRIADGVVIFYGAGNESWLRRKLREVQKSAGYGRSKPEPEIGICLIPPRTPEKERFRTHKGTLLAQWDGVTPDPWQSFIARLKGGRNQRLDHAADSPG